jgi:hypothetical protein
VAALARLAQRVARARLAPRVARARPARLARLAAAAESNTRHDGVGQHRCGADRRRRVFVEAERGCTSAIRLKSFDTLTAFPQTALVFGVALALAACSRVRQPAEFAGRSEPPIADATRVGDEPVVPQDYEELGRVSADCTLLEPRGELDRAWLSDVDCSVSRLVLAMREAAAAAGGELLVGRECRSGVPRDTDEGRETRIRCRAGVARPLDDTLARRPLRARETTASTLPGVDARTAAALDEPTGTAAWRIQIDFEPAKGAPQRAARRADYVNELSVMPVSHVPLGDVIARCDGKCSEAEVRAGVRVAAGRLGASDVVAVRCINEHTGLMCAGTAATTERDLSLESAMP